jgi:hypothetical protein
MLIIKSPYIAHCIKSHVHPKGAPEWDPKGDSKGDSKGVASKRSGIRKEWDPKGVGSKRRYFDIIMSRACYTNRDILLFQK